MCVGGNQGGEIKLWIWEMYMNMKTIIYSYNITITLF